MENKDNSQDGVYLYKNLKKRGFLSEFIAFCMFYLYEKLPRYKKKLDRLVFHVIYTYIIVKVSLNLKVRLLRAPYLGAAIAYKEGEKWSLTVTFNAIIY